MCRPHVSSRMLLYRSISPERAFYLLPAADQWGRFCRQIATQRQISHWSTQNTPSSGSLSRQRRSTPQQDTPPLLRCGEGLHQRPSSISVVSPVMRQRAVVRERQRQVRRRTSPIGRQNCTAERQAAEIHTANAAWLLPPGLEFFWALGYAAPWTLHRESRLLVARSPCYPPTMLNRASDSWMVVALPGMLRGMHASSSCLPPLPPKMHPDQQILRLLAVSSTVDRSWFGSSLEPCMSGLTDVTLTLSSQFD